MLIFPGWYQKSSFFLILIINSSDFGNWCQHSFAQILKQHSTKNNVRNTFFFLIKSLNNRFFFRKKNITFGSVCQNNDFFFPENEQLKQGNYLHCFSKKKFSKSEVSDFF